MSKTFLQAKSVSGGKFWEAWVEGTTFFSRYGSVMNSAGGSLTQKDFTTSEAAERHLQKQITAKRKKGYNDADSSNVPPSPVKQTAKKRLHPKSAAVPASEASAAKTYLEAPSASGGKFWEAWVEGIIFFSRFGKIGSGGSISPKGFETEDEALQHMKSQVAAKLKKGYVHAENEFVGSAGGDGDEDGDIGDEEGKGQVNAPAKKKRKSASAKKSTSTTKKKSTSTTKKKKTKEASKEVKKTHLEADSTSGGKFWEAWVEDSTFFSCFGKLGAEGTVSQKEFDTKEKAAQWLQKQVTAKKKKGYK